MSRLSATVLVLEAVVIALTIVPAVKLEHVGPAAASLAAGIAAAAALVLAGLARRYLPATLVGGSLLQVLVITSGIVLPAMYVLGGIFAMLWINGLELRQLLIIGGSVLGLAVIAFPFLQPYQQARVINFILPQPNVSYGATYNVEQALIAIGSGGLFGKGYGHGTQTQLRFLKVRHTDFIFSATAEEFGLIGAIVVILVEIFIVWRCIRAAQKARDVAGSMIAYGVAVLLFFQGMANIAVNLKLIPVSGLPLPFISYGGSGLASLMLGVGLVESVVMRHKPLEF